MVVAAAQPERAARLLGAAEQTRESIDLPVPPPERPAHERCVLAVRTALGEEAFAAAWAAGQPRYSLPVRAPRGEGWIIGAGQLLGSIGTSS